jgi:hypothetical protein
VLVVCLPAGVDPAFSKKRKSDIIHLNITSKLDLLENPLLYRWFPGALLGPTKAPVGWTLKDRKPIEGSVLTIRK